MAHTANLPLLTCIVSTVNNGYLSRQKSLATIFADGYADHVGD